MRYIIIIAVLLYTVISKAQQCDLQKVTKEELAEKFYPADTSASAVILYKSGKTYFKLTAGDYWNVVTEVVTRIKIYKKDGYKYATDEIAYSTAGNDIKVAYSNAYTYNLVGNEIVKTHLTSEGEFKQKADGNYAVKKITMPNVKEGSIIEFKSTVVNPSFMVFPDWYFQYEIPAKCLEYTVSVPEYFLYNRYMAGYVNIAKANTLINVPEGRDYKEYVDVFSAKDVKAIKEEAFVNNIENYTGVLKHELCSTNFRYGSTSYSSNWATLCKTIYEHEKFGKELGYSSYFKDDLAKIMAEAHSDREKAEKILNFVKTHMNWDGDYSYLCKKGVKKAYETKTGNVAEINLMLTAMLQEAGLNANPVLVSTQANGIALYPSYSTYNYVIAGVETDKGIELFDATSKYTSPGLLPPRALNWQGRMLKKKGVTLDVDLMPKKSSKESVTISAKLNADGAISGRLREHKTDYYAYVFRDKYASLSEEIYLEKKEKMYGLEIGTYKRNLENPLSGAVTEEYEFVHKGISDIIAGKIYFSPLLFFAAHQNPFKQDVREYPIDFGHPWQDKYMISIAIPEGYTIESLPAPVSLATGENIGSFKYDAVVQNNTIQISVSFDINYANVSQDYYVVLKDFYQKMIDKQREKIVLKKA